MRIFSEEKCDHEWETYTISIGYYSYDIEQAGYCVKCGYDTHGEHFGNTQTKSDKEDKT